MSIFEVLSFDFGAFITGLPGILTIVGIVLLIIGVVLLVNDKKKKDEKKEEVLEELKELPVQEVNEVIPPVAPVVVASEGDGVKEPVVEPVPETVNFSLEQPSVAPVAETPVVVEELPVVSPKIEEIPVVENLNVEKPVQPVVEPVPAPTVYGGATPESTVNLESLEEKPREIYGGANPLENTAPIPSNSVKEAYQGAMSVEKPVEVEPVVAPAAVPSLEQTVMTPAVEPAVVNTPAVEEAVKVETLATEEVEKLEF